MKIEKLIETKIKFSNQQRFQQDALEIPKCIDGRRKCKIREENRSICKYCWLKRCFRAGFKYDGFESIKSWDYHFSNL